VRADARLGGTTKPPATAVHAALRGPRSPGARRATTSAVDGFAAAAAMAVVAATLGCRDGPAAAASVLPVGDARSTPSFPLLDEDSMTTRRRRCGSERVASDAADKESAEDISASIPPPSTPPPLMPPPPPWRRRRPRRSRRRRPVLGATGFGADADAPARWPPHVTDASAARRGDRPNHSDATG